MAELRRLVLERLMRYHRYLTQTRGKNAPATVTSTEIGEFLDIDPTQVRKDLGAIGLRGVGRVGFKAGEVVTAIREVMAFDQDHRAIVVGAGHLGGALMAYEGFQQYGLEILAAFDRDKSKAGQTLAGCPVKHTSSMSRFIKSKGVRLAILTTPASVAQDVTDRLVKAGIKAIWNFSPVRLSAPEDVFVRNEHISLGLSQLAYHLRQ